MTTHLSICICTYKRPELLHDLIQNLQHISIESQALKCEIVVVDNDPDLSATSVLHHWQAHSRFRVVADAFGQSNIASARNRLVALAQGERILFLDDDQHPHDPHWVMAMMNTMDRYQADAVFGAVRPLFAPQTPLWIQQAGHFDMDPPNMPTGTPVTKDLAHSGNSLIRRTCFELVSPPFDPSFGRTGGEDSVFFQHLLAQGCRLVWCAEGAVSEYVPAARATVSWLLKRSYREGQTWARTEMLPVKGWGRATKGTALLARALVFWVLSSLLLLAWLPISKLRCLYWARKCVAQLGKISHFLGGRFAEYG